MITLDQDGPSYRIPAEFRVSLFHQRGVLAAARLGDNENPKKESSGSQFYIVQGKKFTPAQLDSVETFRLGGRKIPPDTGKSMKPLVAPRTLTSLIPYSGKLFQEWM